MKQGTALTKAVIILFTLAVAAYIGIYIWQGFSDPYQFVVSYTYQLDDGAALEGLVVRQEEIIRGASELSEILPEEGEKVKAGAAVARVYSSAEALTSRRKAKALELQLEQLNYAMRRNDNLGDGNELDAELVDTLAQMKSDVSAGKLQALEEDGLNVRSLVLKRTAEPTTNAESLAALQQAAGQVEAELAGLNASADRGTTPITVEHGGIFSGQTDGFEEVLTPAMLEEMTVGQLESLMERTAESDVNAVGKVITDSTWYYAARLSAEDAKRLEEGKSYTISFSGDLNLELSMKLQRLGKEEEGACLVVFSSREHLKDTTLSRFESATLVFHRYTGVWCPAKALRVKENEDGSTTLGVYALAGRKAEFKKVEIVREGDGFYLLKGLDTNRKVLRSGDVFILSNQELYNGKVVA